MMYVGNILFGKLIRLQFPGFVIWKNVIWEQIWYWIPSERSSFFSKPIKPNDKQEISAGLIEISRKCWMAFVGVQQSANQ